VSEKWRPEEELALAAAIARHGDDWNAIGAFVGRTPSGCRYRACTIGLWSPPREWMQTTPIIPAPRTTTALLCGDPIPGRSALDKRMAASG